MFRVGLTGNVAAGKSSVAAVWKQMGAEVIDADVLARRAVEPGSAGLERVREAFGDAVIADGALDRAAVRRLVFADDSARERLEAIVHPEVARLREAEESRLRERGVEVVVHDIPLLFEVGLENEFDMLVLVDAPREVRAERLVRNRGLGVNEAWDLIGAQMASAGKRGRADLVLDNQGTPAQLERRARAAWEEILRRASSAGGESAGWIRVDMHVHTRRSHDSLSDPVAVVERALERGLARLCITDHDEIETALELEARYPGRVIPGEEVKTRERVDIIGLYIRERIPRGTPARETCERIRDQGGLVYVPHPFAAGKGGGGRILPEIEDLVDVVEVFNARLRSDLNERAREWALARSLPMGAGSDAHTVGEVGNAQVELPAFNHDAGALRAALRHGRIHGRTASRWVHLASTFAKLVP